MEEISSKFLQAGLKHLPQRLMEAGVEALVLDALQQISLVPMSLGIPFVQVWNTLHPRFLWCYPTDDFQLAP